MDKFDFYGLSSKDSDATLSKLLQSEETIQTIFNFLKREKGIFTFSGNPGCGKTYLCKAIINDWIKDVYSCRYMYIQDFLTKVKSVIFKDWDCIQEIKDLCETKWFILDDLGANTTMTEWQKEMLLEFVNVRHESMLPTIITTNLTSKALRDLSPRMYSRLKDKTNVFVEISGVDKRLAVKPIAETDEEKKKKKDLEDKEKRAKELYDIHIETIMADLAALNAPGSSEITQMQKDASESLTLPQLK